MLRMLAIVGVVVLGAAYLLGSNAGPPPVPAARPCLVSMEGFQKMEPGMSYDAVRRMVGCDGTEMSTMEVAGISSVTYKWQGAGQAGANVIVTFQNGALVTRAQYGL